MTTPNVQKVNAGSQFDGLAGDPAGSTSGGLFEPGPTGGASIEVRVNSLRFHCDGAAATWELRTVDPNDEDNTPLILTGTSNDLTIEGMLLAASLNEKDVAIGWPLVFTTTGMTGDGWLSVDFDFVPTEG